MIDHLTIEALSGKFLIGALFFVRVMGMIASAPFYSNAAIPTQLKVFFGVIVTIMITGAFWEEQPVIEFNLWYILLLVIKESMVGIAIGFSINLVFWAARFAGGLIDFDMGYRTAVLFDANDNSPTLIGELKVMITLMLFIFLNGHHFILESLFASVRAVPLTYFEVTESTVTLLTKYAVTVFIIAVKIAAPIIIALFLTNLSLALLARVAPQTNIFILSFTAKVVVGVLVLMASVPFFVMVAKYSLSNIESEAMKIILSLNPARV